MRLYNTHWQHYIWLFSELRTNARVRFAFGSPGEQADAAAFVALAVHFSANSLALSRSVTLSLSPSLAGDLRFILNFLCVFFSSTFYCIQSRECE